MSDNEQAVESLLTYRRDAVAAILMNLYLLAGALRGDQKVPVSIACLVIYLNLFAPVRPNFPCSWPTLSATLFQNKHELRRLVPIKTSAT